MNSEDMAALIQRATQEHLQPNPFGSPLTGVRFKNTPQDFVVDEVLAYSPSGEGDHLYLRIEKTDLDHQTFLQQLGKALKVPLQSIGTAGMKDKKAVTRQTVSVPTSCTPLLQKIDDHPNLALLAVNRHDHALRTGKLNGNHFRIRVLGTLEDLKTQIDERREAIRERGFPNYFGSQRFGHQGKNTWKSLHWLLPETFPSEKRFTPRGKLQTRLFYSVLQSLVFNACLAERVERDLLHKVLTGDVLAKTDNGGLFLSENVEEEVRRIQRKEISVTGPLPGRKDRWSGGPERELESEILRRFGVNPGIFEDSGKLALGSRRPCVVWPQNLMVEVDSDGAVLSFFLPAGSYATVLLHQFFAPEDALQSDA